MLLGNLSRVLNRGLADSPRAQALCAQLAGRALAIEVSGTRWAAILESDGRQLNLIDQRERPAEATIVGTPLSLLSLARDDQRAVIQRGDVQIRGDAELAQGFAELIHLLRPDVEHELSQLIGRMPAHLLLRGAGRLGNWGAKLAESGLRNTADYLAHESRDLVPRGESEHFLRNVEQLREQLDRLEAGMAQLEQRAGRLARSGAQSRS